MKALWTRKTFSRILLKENGKVFFYRRHSSSCSSFFYVLESEGRSNIYSWFEKRWRSINRWRWVDRIEVKKNESIFIRLFQGKRERASSDEIDFGRVFLRIWLVENWKNKKNSSPFFVLHFHAERIRPEKVQKPENLLFAFRSMLNLFRFSNRSFNRSIRLFKESKRFSASFPSVAARDDSISSTIDLIKNDLKSINAEIHRVSRKILSHVNFHQSIRYRSVHVEKIDDFR